MSLLLNSLNKDTQILEKAYQQIVEKKAKKCTCKASGKNCNCDDCVECKDTQEKDEKEESNNKLTAKQKKLPPALRAAMTKKEKVKESFEEAYNEIIAKFIC